MRNRFIHWLRTNVFKVKEDEYNPRLLRWICNVLYPCYTVRQRHLDYDPCTDAYTINGMKFSAEIFRLLHDESKKGSKFQLLQTDGKVCTVRYLPEFECLEKASSN